jgi:hypothetical protein
MRTAQNESMAMAILFQTGLQPVIAENAEAAESKLESLPQITKCAPRPNEFSSEYCQVA